MPGGKNTQKTEVKSSGTATSTQHLPFGSPVSKRTRSRGTKSATTASTSVTEKTDTNKSVGVQKSRAKGAKSAVSHSKSGSVKSPTKVLPSTKSGVKSVTKKRVRKVDASSTGKMMANVPEPMEVDDDNMMGVVTAKSSLSKPSTLPSSEEVDNCSICMSEMENPKKLDKCGHEFCTECIDQCFVKMNPVCPICGTVYGDMIGIMPPGTMNVFYQTESQLEGYHGCGIIIIEYIFPDGTQTHEHPHPGKRYYGTHRMAYLPNNQEGRAVLALLRRAFDSRMTFTVGRSATTGLDDQVIWNDIHHKTRTCGGSTAFGYPDPTYLSRVTQELASKGIK